MCTCLLDGEKHWYIDINGPAIMWVMASSPEEAEAALRSWAARVLKGPNMILCSKAVASRTLRSRAIHMVAMCECISEEMRVV